ncbi:MAG: hypothetical protein EOP07_00200 [Proteobacteria bacterium]|nr:MAG: hypothetical protein EOP07_00200 [Pseudomonadota bacterium]
MPTRKLMSSIKGLTQKFKGKSEEAPQSRESRVHPRFDLKHSNLFQAQLPDGSSAPILNLSFGGLSLGSVPTEDQVPIIINVLGRSIKSQIGVTHRGSQLIGSRFEPKEAALLNFLQPLLAALQQGLSLSKIDASALKDTAKEKYEWILRGEGPTDLLIGSSLNPIAHVAMTFRMDKDYLQLMIQDHQVTTARSADDHGLAARMNLDAAPDPKVIEQSILILTGAMAQDELLPVLGPVVSFLEKLLDH